MMYSGDEILGFGESEKLTFTILWPQILLVCVSKCHGLLPFHNTETS
jgi:hypothetical protein